MKKLESRIKVYVILTLAGEKDIEVANAGEMVWHIYNLVRGATKADVGELIWEEDGQWAGFGSSNGTLHRCTPPLLKVGH